MVLGMRTTELMPFLKEACDIMPSLAHVPQSTALKIIFHEGMVFLRKKAAVVAEYEQQHGDLAKTSGIATARAPTAHFDLKDKPQDSKTKVLQRKKKGLIVQPIEGFPSEELFFFMALKKPIKQYASSNKQMEAYVR